MDEEVVSTEVEEIVEEKPTTRYLQVRFTSDEFKEINLHLINNDIPEKNDWVKMLILREMRGYEPVQTNERLHDSENGDGFNAFR